MTFRARLLATLRAIKPVLNVPGVMVVGSEVPNLLEQQAASTLVVSQDVDIGIPVEKHETVKRALVDVHGLRPSPEEPSVWLPETNELIEVNFLGIDSSKRDVAEAYVLEDSTLPLLVFGSLTLMRLAPLLDVEGLKIPVPRPAGLLVEKLITDRTAEKGDRDLLVALGLLLLMQESDILEAECIFSTLPLDLRYSVCANLTVLSLLNARPGMPDPSPHRQIISELLARFETIGK